jgi:enamine deaminase RidA (YjgF/YER057c/UK114 family)
LVTIRTDCGDAAREDAMNRRSIHAEGYRHAAAIPTASRIGPLLASSVIAPFDVDARTMPHDAEGQARNVFRHIGAILDAGEASWDDVLKVTFFVAESDLRTVVEPLWVERFPDEDSRPARHIQVTSLPGRVLVQAEFLAYVDR